MDELFQWVSALKDKEVFSNTTMIDTTKYGDFAFWWFLRYRLFIDLSMIFNSKKKHYRRSLGRFIISKLSGLYLLSVILFALFSKLFFPKTMWRKKVEKKIFVTFNTGDWRGFRDIQTGKYLRGHSLFGPILRSLSEKQDSYEYFSSYPFGYSFFSFAKLAFDARISQQLGRFSPLESYFTWKSLVHVFRARNMFMRRFDKITRSEEGKRVFNYRGLNLLTLFQTDFEYYFKVYLPLMVQYYELSLQVLEIEKPDLVLMENEYVGFERALIYACHNKRVPSLAQQHGVIHEDHPGYLYAKEDIGTQEYSKYPFCPLATITSVIGPSFKEVLTNVSAYPESKVAISGQPRYDVFYFVDRIYDRAAFLKRFNLDPTKKIVLLATQPFPLEHLRHEFFTNTLNNLKAIEGIQIVVKPHPNESTEWFTNQLASLETNVVVLPPFYDTIEAIYATDVFLSVNSTTIIEALILNKPVVVVNLSKQTEPLPWVKEEAALGAYEAESIESAVEKALNDEKVRKKLHDKRTDFVYKHLYKIDGKATDRVIDLIQKLAK
jgi:hypothetical protein